MGTATTLTAILMMRKSGIASGGRRGVAGRVTHDAVIEQDEPMPVGDENVGANPDGENREAEQDTEDRL